MKKKEAEIISKVVDSCLHETLKCSCNVAKLYEDKIKMNEKFLYELEEQEPPKLFKGMHKDWESRINWLKNEIERDQKNWFEELKEIESCIAYLNPEE